MITKTFISQKIRPCLDKMAALVKSELGESFTLDTSSAIRFDGEQAKIGITFLYTQSDIECIINVKALDLQKRYPLFYNRNLVYMGKTYQIVGYNKKATKYPFVVKNLTDNKNYHMTFDMVHMFAVKEEV